MDPPRAIWSPIVSPTLGRSSTHRSISTSSKQRNFSWIGALASGANQPTAANPAHRRVGRKAGDPPIHLPRGTCHTLENPSDTEPLVVKIRVDLPGSHTVREEQFFRDFFGYVEDCRRNGGQPSLFQRELFLSTVDGPLAIPCPGPERVKWWRSRIVRLFRGVMIGEWVLGYRRTSPEYYSGQDTSL
ncbi:hypothetical protein BJ875DRAFT_485261 [Amylocarpus encephaloides]|uniref:Uncharacterized protein n=1 Tax=Amylocarpus encephaloides TaxID=45428 RepID=A0A9P8C5S4_9HELO|nr:hypothetical protein BJ875DRAFT_485261 [Amylocarpus encephaloides]